MRKLFTILLVLAFALGMGSALGARSVASADYTPAAATRSVGGLRFLLPADMAPTEAANTLSNGQWTLTVDAVTGCRNTAQPVEQLEAALGASSRTAARAVAQEKLGGGTVLYTAEAANEDGSYAFLNILAEGGRLHPFTLTLADAAELEACRALAGQIIRSAAIESWYIVRPEPKTESTDAQAEAQSDPQPAENPDPQPVENPDPQPAENPDPQPVVNPDPQPVENPDPQPVVNPDPQPAENPDPQPAENPDPQPAENPDPQPAENPDPQPVENPDPQPVENPDPQPAENPDPQPVENPDPQPVENPDPQPAENPDPQPVENPDPQPAENPDPQPAENPDPQPAEQPSPYRDVAAAYEALNRFRTTPGIGVMNPDNNSQTVFNADGATNLQPLQRSEALEDTARTRAKEITEIFDHVRPDGSICFTAFPDGLWRMSENIAAGFSNAESVTQAWAEEGQPYDGQGHRRNMLDPNVNQVGIACYEHEGMLYWVQDFGLTP